MANVMDTRSGGKPAGSQLSDEQWATIQAARRAKRLGDLDAMNAAIKKAGTLADAARRERDAKAAAGKV